MSNYSKIREMKHGMLTTSKRKGIVRIRRVGILDILELLFEIDISTCVGIQIVDNDRGLTMHSLVSAREVQIYKCYATIPAFFFYLFTFF